MRLSLQAVKVRRASTMSVLLWLCGCSGGSTATDATTGTTGTTGTNADTQPTTTDGGSTTTGGGSTTTGGGSTTTGGGSTTDDCSGGSTTGGVDFGCDGTTGVEPGGDVCACIVDDPEGGPGWPSDPLCGEALCPKVLAVKTMFCRQLMVMNPDALTCALTALRDRTPGVVRWSWEQDGGQFSDGGYVLINADGTAIRRHSAAMDLDFEVFDADWGTMPNACTFEMCLAAGSEELRFECLSNFPLAAPHVTCDLGWAWSDL